MAPRIPIGPLRLGLTAATVLALCSAAVGDDTRSSDKKKEAMDAAQRRQFQEKLYTKIHPQYRETDASALIEIGDPESLAARRRELTGLIFGTDAVPSDLVVHRTGKRHDDPGWPILPPLRDLHTLEHRMEYGIVSSMYYLHANKPCSRLVLFHEGHGRDFKSKKKVITKLLQIGYDVIALDMPVTGRNKPPVVELEGVGRILLDKHHWFVFLQRPLRFFFEPIAAAVNFALEEKDYEEVVMVGFSGGGWATTVYAAMDPRIRRSYPVAGTTPLYLRSSTPERTEKGLGDFEQIHPELLRTANYLEMYVMGASGEGRRQLQVINQFDRNVPFHGVKHETYVPAVREAVDRLGPGSFNVFLDASPGAHDIHDETLRKLVEELRPGCREGAPGRSRKAEDSAPPPD